MSTTLSRSQAKLHREACLLIDADRDLDDEEKKFVLDHWQEAANPEYCLDGAYFTPLGLAGDMRIDVVGTRIIDLCAGIGHLSFACRNLLDHRWNGEPPREFVCVERNPEYVRIGMRIMPEATWVCADVLTVPSMRLRSFDTAIANPPFGPIRRAMDGPGYRGPRFEYHVIAVAAQLARHGVFLVPQQSAPFSHSGKRCYTEDPDAEYQKFHTTTGIALELGCSVDTTYYADDWHQRPIATEIVVCDFTQHHSAIAGTDPRPPANGRRFTRTTTTTSQPAGPSAA
ncbi:methyltransferase [Nocardia arthritidis]|uniref:Methyltransferase n=1 Tax=Nocardia arthritidis TaxID=228602 RepID=A0A6G9YA33_9NOCA|nr:methyltransferase [Nocardia arthritidis]QIS09903.1 methyltransferase [Nocardia arthritidis]